MRVRKGVLLGGFVLGAIGLSATLTEGTRRTDDARGNPEVLRQAHQHAGHTTVGAPPGLALAVDGALNPELVPDERAWAHFLGALAAADPKGREAALTQAGLAEADRAAFGGALGPLREELSAVAEKRKAGEAAERLLQHQQMAVTNARARLQHALPTEARAQLEHYVQTHVKSRIKIYRGPMPAPIPGGVR